MYVRVATFENSGDIDAAVDQVKGDVENDSRPPGLEDAKGMMMLVNRDTGKSMGIVMFETEEALKRGDAALNEISPNDGATTQRIP